MVKVIQSKKLDANLPKVKLREFVDLRARRLKKSRDENSTLGGETNAFVEFHRLNKQGFGMFNRLNEMPPEKRADALRTLDICRAHYSEDWTKQAELALSGDEEKAA